VETWLGLFSNRDVVLSFDQQQQRINRGSVLTCFCIWWEMIESTGIKEAMSWSVSQILFTYMLKTMRRATKQRVTRKR
jgi:hypothetical protein